MLSMLIICPPSFSAILEGTTSDVPVLKDTTYSETMIRTIDMIKAHNTYGINKYHPYYTYNTDPDNPARHTLHWYKKLRNQLDPAQDDGYFGMHEINFNNRFFIMEPSQNIFDKNSPEYSRRARDKMGLDNYEDL